jgi:hypothetical protein
MLNYQRVFHGKSYEKLDGLGRVKKSTSGFRSSLFSVNEF